MSIRINRVYTRSGDKGETSLVGGSRVSKSHPRVCAYGDVDELNAVLGCVKERVNQRTEKLRSLLEQLQQELFDVGSELATEQAYEGMWNASESDVTRLEKLCDSFGEGLPELKSFILPGGSELVSFLHLARTVSRRAERSLVALNENGEELNPYLIHYLNRLSDLLFVLCRWSLAQEGVEAPLWVQASERGKSSTSN